MKKVILCCVGIVAAIPSIASCSGVTRVKGPHGEELLQVKCSDEDACAQKANDRCPHGFARFSEGTGTEEQSGSAASGEQKMLFVCRGEPESRTASGSGASEASRSKPSGTHGPGAESPTSEGDDMASEGEPETFGYGGFVFGDDVSKAQSKCEGTKHHWTTVSESACLCSGAAADTGISGVVGLEFCDGKVCGVLVMVRPAGRDSKTWMDQYAAAQRMLVSKFGEPRDRKSAVGSGRCVDDLLACVEDGTAKLSANWSAPKDRAISLTLDKEKQPIAIRIVFRSGKAKGAPKSEPTPKETPKSEPTPKGAPKSAPKGASKAGSTKPK